MIDFFVWILVAASVGLTLIIKDGEIFRIPREWLKSKCIFLKKLLSCAQCLGFWCGFAIASGYVLAGGKFDWCLVYMALMIAFASSIFSLITNLIVEYLDDSVFIKEKQIQIEEQKENKKKKLLNE